MNEWMTSGNTGLDPSNDFIGTIDASPVVIRTNNEERLRFTVEGACDYSARPVYFRQRLGDRDEGGLEVGSQDNVDAGRANGRIGFPGYGVRHGQIRWVPGHGQDARFELVDSSSNSPSGDYGSDRNLVGIHAAYAVAHGVTLGVSSIGGISYEPYAYESVGVTHPAMNLRLQSPNSIMFHTGNDPVTHKVIFTPQGHIHANGLAAHGVSVGIPSIGGISYEPYAYESVGVTHPAMNLRLQSPNSIMFHTGNDPVTEKVIITPDGDIQLRGADCAEYFPVSADETVSPGMVVSTNDAGYIFPTCIESDSRVVGIVSGAGNLRPGVTLGYQNDPSSTATLAPVALAGTVYCLVDAMDVSVKVGDLLMSSSRPGYACKVGETSSPQGILGKALAPLRNDRGLIKVLVRNS